MSDDALVAAAQRVLDDCFTYHTSLQHDYDRPCPIHLRSALMVLGYSDLTRRERATQRRLMDRGVRFPSTCSRDAAELAEAIRVTKELVA
jgi:hypothetical protein